MKRIFALFILGAGLNSLVWTQTNMVLVKGGRYHFTNESYGLVIDTIIYIPDFYIDKTEITIKDFESFVIATGYITDAEKNGESIIVGGKEVEGVNWRHDENGNLRLPEDYHKYPVIHVSWDDAMEYANWRGKRLPTEAEWEYAFREGGKANYKYSGSNNVRRVAWNTEDPHVRAINPVGMKMPNSLGIYDMSGNVAEYTIDPYDKTGKSRPLYVKVAKGGSFVDNIRFLQYNARIPSGRPTFLFGFRCIKYLDE